MARPISLRLSDEDLAAIDRARGQTSRTEWIRRVLRLAAGLRPSPGSEARERARTEVEPRFKGGKG